MLSWLCMITGMFSEDRKSDYVVCGCVGNDILHKVSVSLFLLSFWIFVGVLFLRYLSQ